jgi:Dyp-type peroxidase family
MLFSDPEKANIQGFITSAYGHLNFTAYLFLTIADDKRKSRDRASTWLRHLLDHHQIATARSWRKSDDIEKSYPHYAINIAFTHAGLKRLGLDEGTLNSFPVEFIEGSANSKRAEVLGDTGPSSPRNWEFGDTEDADDTVHILLSLMTDSADERDSEIKRIKRELKATTAGAIKIDSLQTGSHMIHQDPATGTKVVKEHFGFNDGLSQPTIRGIRKQAVNARSAGQNVVNTGEMILGYQDEYHTYPVSPLTHVDHDPDHLLHESPYREEHPDYRDFGYNGSFVVYRKLRQEVPRFWSYLREQSEKLFGDTNPRNLLWLAAKMVGRWPNGAPLTLAPNYEDAVNYHGHRNHFLFAKSDSDGSACPFGSHIRRVNPRDQIRPATEEQSLARTARHRIVRRGSTYGDPLFDLGILDRMDDSAALELLREISDDGKERGLHFFCINANIRRQFEFIQQTWAIKRNFNGLRDNPDPIIGNSDGEIDQMLIPGHPDRLRTCRLPAFVTVRAAAYFFMPGLKAINYLANLNR